MKYLLISLLTIFSLQFICIPIYAIYCNKKDDLFKDATSALKAKFAVLFSSCGFVGILLAVLVIYIWRFWL